MNTAEIPTQRGFTHATWIVLGVGCAISVFIHAGVGIGALGKAESLFGSHDSSSSAIDVNPIVQEAITAPKEIRLGMQDGKHASIHWLGVVENPQVGDAPIADVEQADLTTQEGNANQTTAPQEPSEAAIQEQAVEMTKPVVKVEQPPAVQVEPAIEAILKEPILIEPTLKEPIAQPKPMETATEPIDLEIKQVESDVPAMVIEDERPEHVDEVKTEPSESIEPVTEERVVEDSALSETTPAEVVTVEPREESIDPVLQAEQPTEQPTEQPAEQPAESSAESSTEQQSLSTPAPAVAEISAQVAGKKGIQSDRESTASIIKRAIKVDANTLHKPIVGQGLEILTVDPRFPASVRFTQLPRNPVLLIRFNALGVATSVKFLREGLKVYDTGSKVVDEPLINAVYQWRAKGKELDALDPDDLESTIEISMRILFRKDIPEP